MNTNIHESFRKAQAECEKYEAANHDVLKGFLVAADIRHLHVEYAYRYANDEGHTSYNVVSVTMNDGQKRFFSGDSGDTFVKDLMALELPSASAYPEVVDGQYQAKLTMRPVSVHYFLQSLALVQNDFARNNGETYSSREYDDEGSYYSVQETAGHALIDANLKVVPATPEGVAINRGLRFGYGR